MWQNILFPTHWVISMLCISMVIPKITMLIIYMLERKKIIYLIVLGMVIGVTQRR